MKGRGRGRSTSRKKNTKTIPVRYYFWFALFLLLAGLLLVNGTWLKGVFDRLRNREEDRSFVSEPAAPPPAETPPSAPDQPAVPPVAQPERTPEQPTAPAQNPAPSATPAPQPEPGQPSTPAQTAPPATPARQPERTAAQPASQTQPQAAPPATPARQPERTAAQPASQAQPQVTPPPQPQTAPPASRTQPQAAPPATPARQPERTAGQPASQTRPQVTPPPQPQTAPPAPSARTVEREIYLVNVDPDGSIVRSRVSRRLPSSDAPLLDALNALIRGPTAQEARAGLRSMIPEGTRVLGAWVRDRTAFINFSEEFQFNPYGVEGWTAQMRQIIWTATEFSTVNNVQVLIEGKRIDYLGEGIWIGGPAGRESF